MSFVCIFKSIAWINFLETNVDYRMVEKVHLIGYWIQHKNVSDRVLFTNSGHGQRRKYLYGKSGFDCSYKGHRGDVTETFVFAEIG